MIRFLSLIIIITVHNLEIVGFLFESGSRRSCTSSHEMNLSLSPEQNHNHRNGSKVLEVAGDDRRQLHRKCRSRHHHRRYETSRSTHSTWVSCQFTSKKFSM